MREAASRPAEYSPETVVSLYGGVGSKRPDEIGALEHGGSGGDGMGLDERVARLETHFEYVRRDLDEIKVDQKAVLAAVKDLPNKNDLWMWKIQWMAIGLAAIALVVGGIIGGLAWVKPEPIIITLPQSTQQP
jgi:hypothetical protein